MSDEERTQRYRDEAVRCRRLAESIGDAAIEGELLRIASAYERLAGHISNSRRLFERQGEIGAQDSAVIQTMSIEGRAGWFDWAGSRRPSADRERKL